MENKVEEANDACSDQQKISVEEEQDEGDLPDQQDGKIVNITSVF